ncbi:hypothetical protein [Allobranchiibius huperziae]|uniref:Transcriptional regulator n=1 Tax=Allobranchiibius huperziae TaxID=1874116 RepID=A0A853DKK6_9MICO|nr:hypothetical protein [Allobranchiibius huperziae]NYJ76469.1 hypothetical protein [Allobranchiibius huperziae]
MIEWDEGDLARRTPDPTPEVLAVVTNPFCWRVWVFLLGAGPAHARDVMGPAGLSEASVLKHLQNLRKAGFAMSSVGEKQDRWRWWQVVPGGLRLTDVLHTGDQQRALQQWLEAFVINQQTILREWLRRRDRDPEEWTQAALSFEIVARLTAGELDAMSEEIYQVMMKWLARAKEHPADMEGVRSVYAAANAVLLTGEK